MYQVGDCSLARHSVCRRLQMLCTFFQFNFWLLLIPLQSLIWRNTDASDFDTRLTYSSLDWLNDSQMTYQATTFFLVFTFCFTSKMWIKTFIFLGAFSGHKPRPVNQWYGFDKNVYFVFDLWHYPISINDITSLCVLFIFMLLQKRICARLPS